MIAKLKTLLLVLVPLGVASGAGAYYYVTVINANSIPPCTGLQYDVSQQTVSAHNSGTKTIEISGYTYDPNGHFPPSQSPFTLAPGQSQMVYSFTPNGYESLTIDSSAFNSNTNVTLYIRNSGTYVAAHTNNYTITTKMVVANTVYACQHFIQVSYPAESSPSVTTLTAYYVRDSSGNTWELSNWNGPSISPNQVVPTNILIGSICPSCTLSGSAFTFQTGYQYTIIFVTSQNNTFSEASFTLHSGRSYQITLYAGFAPIPSV